MSSKHTPGPWQVRPGKTSNGINNDFFHSSIEQKEGHQYEVAAIWKDLPTHEQVAANAKLIAAAPELLDALVSLYNSIDSCIDLTPEILQSAKAAIDKATL